VELASSWFDGSYSDAGCTIPLIVEWIGSFGEFVQTQAHEHWDQMFSIMNEEISPETSQFLDYSLSIWRSLWDLADIIFDSLENKAGNFIKSHILFLCFREFNVFLFD